MSKVTSKLQVTIPKKIADAHGIEPGTHLRFESAGEIIRVHVVDPLKRAPDDLNWRLELFDQATARQAERAERVLTECGPAAAGRGWRREELYSRGSAD